jgi:hypothetical protein
MFYPNYMEALQLKIWSALKISESTKQKEIKSLTRLPVRSCRWWPITTISCKRILNGGIKGCMKIQPRTHECLQSPVLETGHCKATLESYSFRNESSTLVVCSKIATNKGYIKIIRGVIKQFLELLYCRKNFYEYLQFTWLRLTARSPLWHKGTYYVVPVNQISETAFCVSSRFFVFLSRNPVPLRELFNLEE